MGPPPSAFGQPRSWYLDEKTQERCKEELGKLSKEQYTHSNVAAHGRQWCWMGMKEFGCHRVVNQRYTWKEAQSFAALMNVTVPPKVASFQPLLRPEVCEAQSLGKPRRWTQEDWTAAGSWFEDNVQLYVLNMAAFKARWRTMTERLAKLDLESIRVEGVDLRPPDAMKSVVDEGLIPEGFNYSEASHEAAKASNNMGGGILGTVGCAAAHFRAQTRALVDSGRTGGKPLAVVLEDDVALAEDFVVRLWSLVREELPCDWEVVSLSSRCPYGTCVSPHLSRVEPDGNEPASRCRHGVNYGFQGVLYRSSRIPDFQGTWKKTVFDSERPHCLDIDVALASISDRVGFYAVPFIQKPGFLEEVWQGSARETVNR